MQTIVMDIRDHQLTQISLLIDAVEELVASKYALDIKNLPQDLCAKRNVGTPVPIKFPKDI